MFESIFWISIFLVIYVYFLYPIIIYLLSLNHPRKNKYNLLLNSDLPEITIITPIYNEASLIQKKHQNYCDLDYPQDKIKFIFISDGSTDNSNDILNKLHNDDSRVKILIEKNRSGKPNAINKAVQQVKTDTIVFCDIRQQLSNDSIRHITSELLNDPKNGLVCGELVHIDTDGSTSENIGLYWKYEKWIRNSESNYKSMLGTTGALYCMRLSDYSEIETDTILDDFVIPMNVVKNNKNLKINFNAKFYDKIPDNMNQEKARKIRTLSGNFQSFSRMPWLFNPFKNPIIIQFISHKVLRLIIPYLLVIIIISNLLIMTGSIFYSLIIFTQFIFYSTAYLAFKNNKIRKIKLFNLFYVFVELNICAVLGLIQHINKTSSVLWKKY